MKKFKQILAGTSVVLLVLMYLCTLIFALTDNPKTMGFFKASVALTILIPVLSYAGILMYRLLHRSE